MRILTIAALAAMSVGPLWAGNLSEPRVEPPVGAQGSGYDTGRQGCSSVLTGGSGYCFGGQMYYGDVPPNGPPGCSVIVRGDLYCLNGQIRRP